MCCVKLLNLYFYARFWGARWGCSTGQRAGSDSGLLTCSLCCRQPGNAGSKSSGSELLTCCLCCTQAGNMGSRNTARGLEGQHRNVFNCFESQTPMWRLVCARVYAFAEKVNITRNVIWTLMQSISTMAYIRSLYRVISPGINAHCRTQPFIILHWCCNDPLQR